MRPCLPAAVCLAVAAAVLPVAGAAASARADTDAAPATASCATAGDREFPLTTRLHGGPAGYTAGGGYGVWYVDLTNTTDRTCTAVHPVIVLVDAERALKPGHAQLEFYDRGTVTAPADTTAPGTPTPTPSSTPTPHPVRFELTDEDELVGALADDEAGFRGFTVGPGRTLTVKVRLQFTSAAVANEIVANAAVVQRHKDDGDWVGQSNDYRFRVEAAPGTGTGEPDPDARRDPEEDRAPSPGPHPRPGDSTGPPSSTAPAPGTPAPSASSPSPLPLADELAASGTRARILAVAAAALLAGGAAVLLARSRG
ncbi:hypothetical protein ACIRPP_19925 [Streptomyces sp. NPDC101219]|uniref:hypothetical protein n=1 Tax=Streptomyces sp. NPDC101219 TaxID=3366131 RepID=UPI003800D518